MPSLAVRASPAARYLALIEKIRVLDRIAVHGRNHEQERREGIVCPIVPEGVEVAPRRGPGCTDPDVAEPDFVSRARRESLRHELPLNRASFVGKSVEKG